MSETTLHKAVLRFWEQAGPEAWFAKDDAFDRTIRDEYEPLHHAAARGELSDWAADWEGALALILLLDQFPRNLYRNSGHAFATDGLARRVALEAIEDGFDLKAPMPLRIFFYLPLEHSEDPVHQARSVELFESACQSEPDDEFAKWARLHRDIIERFGRFPHRNACLGRKSTVEEQTFLAEGGFTG